MTRRRVTSEETAAFYAGADPLPPDQLASCPQCRARVLIAHEVYMRPDSEGSDGARVRAIALDPIVRRSFAVYQWPEDNEWHARNRPTLLLHRHQPEGSDDDQIGSQGEGYQRPGVEEVLGDAIVEAVTRIEDRRVDPAAAARAIDDFATAENALAYAGAKGGDEGGCAAEAGAAFCGFTKHGDIIGPDSRAAAAVAGAGGGVGAAVGQAAEPAASGAPGGGGDGGAAGAPDAGREAGACAGRHPAAALVPSPLLGALALEGARQVTASAAAFTAPALNVQDDPRYGILFLSYEGAVRRGVVFWPDVAGIVESKAQGGKDLFVLLLRSGAFVQAPLAENSDVFARSEATKRNLAGVSLAELAAARATGQAYHDLVSRADVGALTDLVVRELAARTKAGAG